MTLSLVDAMKYIGDYKKARVKLDKYTAYLNDVWEGVEGSEVLTADIKKLWKLEDLQFKYLVECISIYQDLIFFAERFEEVEENKLLFRRIKREIESLPEIHSQFDYKITSATIERDYENI